MLPLNTPITRALEITKIQTKSLEKLRIFTLSDLLYHFPNRYDDFSMCKKIEDLRLGESATFKGKISKLTTKKIFGGKTITEAYITDETGQILAVWFGFSRPLTFLREGKYIRISGKISLNRKMELQLQHPNFELIPKSQIKPEEEQIINLDEDFSADKTTDQQKNQTVKQPDNQTTNSGLLVPIYPQTAGLNSYWFKKIIKISLPQTQLIEFIPADILKDENLLGLKDAFYKIHFPKNHQDIEQAKKRFSFEKMFLIQLRVLRAKKNWESQLAPKLNFDQIFIKKFVDQLPFSLTNAQKKSAWQIIQDLEKTTAMNRLLEGDVGSGKTIVATLAMLSAAQNHHQSTLLAPTEVLATQHFQGIAKFLKNLPFKIALLTGSQAQIFDNPTNYKLKTTNHAPSNDQITVYQTIPKPELLKKINDGQIDLIIGTHALLQKTVAFKNLALVIIDEQHRFGVGQRAFLQQKTLSLNDGQKSTVPHLLTMTATPIPRTLSLAVFGNLNLSIIDEYPKGRKKIITKIIPPNERKRIYLFIQNQISAGRQAFIICPLVEDSEKMTQVKSATEEFKRIQAQFPKLKIGLLHGKIKPKEKTVLMDDFKAKKFDILVATSVIEVGVDVPNATIIIIESAERFGLSQLHQFRGRVGRAEHQSYCFLFTSQDTSATTRLKIMEETDNGFKIAQRDLELRGPGQFLGANQSGPADLAMECLTDIYAIQSARNQAERVLAHSPNLEKFPLLQSQLETLEKITHWE